MEQCLLVLIVSPSIGNAMVDWLLEYDDLSGFTSMTISGHGGSAHSLTAAEQVAGQRRQVMFHVHLSREMADIIVADARRAFNGSGIHYWVMPVLAAGHLD